MNAELTKLRVDVQTLAKAGDKKKSIKTTKADTAEGAAAGANTNVAGAATPEEKFPLNKMVYFKQEAKKPEYLEKYIKKLEETDQGVRKLMEEDKTVADKKNEVEKAKARASWLWLYIKNNNQAVGTQIETEYKEAKNNFQLRTKPLQQTTEAHTPDNHKEANGD